MSNFRIEVTTYSVVVTGDAVDALPSYLYAHSKATHITKTSTGEWFILATSVAVWADLDEIGRNGSAVHKAAVRARGLADYQCARLNSGWGFVATPNVGDYDEAQEYIGEHCFT